MKTFLKIALCLCFTATHAFAQSPDGSNQPVEPKIPAFYIGLGTGLNSTTGVIGAKFGVLVSKKVLIDFGAGFGSWGYKLGVTGYYETPSNWNPFIGFSRATGLDSLVQSLEVTTNGITSTKSVAVIINPVTLVNFGIQKQWFTASGNRLYLDMGYSFSLNSTPYQLKDNTSQLTITSQKVLNLAAPGGLLIAFGYSFRLR